MQINKDAHDFAQKLHRFAQDLDPKERQKCIKPLESELCIQGKKLIEEFYLVAEDSYFFKHITVGGCKDCRKVIDKALK